MFANSPVSHTFSTTANTKVEKPVNINSKTEQDQVVVENEKKCH